MKFISTRSGADKKLHTFEEALFSGFCEDGGLMVPERIPSVTVEDLARWKDLAFEDLAYEVAKLYIEDEIPEANLRKLLHDSFTTFDIPEVIAVNKVGPVYISELFHGPTLAFKDIALQFVGQVLDHFLTVRKKKMTLLIATSGDTGSAAIHSVKGRENIQCFVLFPIGRISQTQERQMTTVLDSNIHVIGVTGTTSDGLDDIMKRVFADTEFKNQYNINSINSINIARIIIQTVIYFYSYLRSVDKAGEEVIFSIPTGAFGNGVAALFSRAMGLPIKTIIAATNENDILNRFFTTGLFESGTSVPTCSPAMDIQVPYNFERFLFLLTNGDTQKVKELMVQFETTGKINLAGADMEKARQMITSFSISNPDTLKVMTNFHQEFGYVLDPHTAVGVVSVLRHSKFDGATKIEEKVNIENFGGEKLICLSTAHPAKFSEAVLQATKLEVGKDIEWPVPLRGMDSKTTQCLEIPANDKAVDTLKRCVVQYYPK